MERDTRRRIVTFSSEEASSECQHPIHILCLHLPRDFGDGQSIDESTFLLFLRHLYIASTYHLPPCKVKDAIVASLSDDSPISLTFPADQSITQAAICSMARMWMQIRRRREAGLCGGRRCCRCSSASTVNRRWSAADRSSCKGISPRVSMPGCGCPSLSARRWRRWRPTASWWSGKTRQWEDEWTTKSSSASSCCHRPRDGSYDEPTHRRD